MSCRILFVVNDPSFFISHRLPIALAAKKGGYEVHVATAGGDAVSHIKKCEFFHHVLPLSRSGRNPLQELVSIWSLWKLMRHVKPRIVHLVTIKPVLYGGIAARLAGVPAMVAAISGLGTVFIAQTYRACMLRSVVTTLYKLALGHKNKNVIFQNPDDKEVLIKLGAVQPEQAVMIKGSGVELADYPVSAEPEGVPVIAFASRLLTDKGVEDFVDAARRLKVRNVAAHFWLIGTPDPGNPTSVTEKKFEAWKQESIVDCLGYRDDIPDLFSRAHVVVLPSYYGEGLPKVLIEAAASGRAVITTDHPGCRDAIEPGVTGLLVPVRDSEALADAIERLIKDIELRQKMGRAGRELAEREFAIEKVVAAHLDVYSEVLAVSENARA